MCNISLGRYGHKLLKREPIILLNVLIQEVENLAMFIQFF